MTGSVSNVSVLDLIATVGIVDMKVLVTGVAGFIGSHVAEALLARDHAVVGMDRNADGWVSIVKDNAPHGCFTFVQADIQDKESMHFARAAYGKLDVVAHLAAIANVPDSMRDWPASAYTNAYGAACILDDCREFSTPVVYASTAALYPDDLPDGEQLREETNHFCTRSPYAAEKLLLEKYAALLSSSAGVATLGLRIFNAYGPRDLPVSGHAVPCFMVAALQDKELPAHGGGSAVRDFIYVADVAAAFVDACELLVAGKQLGSGVLNLCSGKGISILDLANHIRKMTNPKITVNHAPKRAGDASVLVGSSRCFTQHFGRPAAVTSLSDGLTRTLEWHRRLLPAS